MHSVLANGAHQRRRGASKPDWLLAEPVTIARPDSGFAKSLRSGNIVIVVDRRAEDAFICPQRARAGFTCTRLSDGMTVKPPFDDE